MSRTSVGRAIRTLRERRHISLRTLATAIEVSPATLSAYERGTTGLTIERIETIAAALGTSAARLVAGSDEPEPPADPDAAVAWRVFDGDTTDPIVAAGIATFMEHGYHGATIRQIASRAGLSVPGVYHHIASKQELLLTILDDLMTDMIDRLESARAEGSSPLERLSFAVESLALTHAHRRDCALVGATEMRSLLPENRIRVVAERNRVEYLIEHEIAATLAAGQLPPPPPGSDTTAYVKSAGRAIATMCQAIPRWFRSDGPLTAEQVAADYRSFALRLLGASSA